MKYNWEEIYKSKTDTELLKIFNGDYLLNTDARISAVKILLERNYDKEEIKEIRDRSIEELDSEIHDIITTDIEKEKRSHIIWSIVMPLIWLVTTCFLVRPDIRIESILETKQVVFFFTVLFMIISTAFGIKFFKKRRLKELQKKLKEIQEIKERLSRKIGV